MRHTQRTHNMLFVLFIRVYDNKRINSEETEVFVENNLYLFQQMKNAFTVEKPHTHICSVACNALNAFRFSSIHFLNFKTLRNHEPLKWKINDRLIFHFFKATNQIVGMCRSEKKASQKIHTIYASCVCASC